MAIGMLISSPLAGIWADRHGSRALAALGMLVSAVALAADDDAPGRQPLLAEHAVAALVGIGSGMFNSPNTAAMMGAVPAYRRGIAAGARTMLQNTGAVISIAFVLAIVTAAVPKPVLFKIFSGLARASRTAKLEPFIPTCTRRCGCWPSPRWSARASRCCGRVTAKPRRRRSAQARARALEEAA